MKLNNRGYKNGIYLSVKYLKYFTGGDFVSKDEIDFHFCVLSKTGR